MYPAGPPPAHRVEIWIGAMKPGALKLIGEQADGWVPGGGISQMEQFPALNAQIDQAARAAGRDPRQIRRIANIGMTDADPAATVDVLVRLGTEFGIDGFVYWPGDDGTKDVERYANEIVPAVKAALTG
jgi:alkanesulfonate monooxygenase SsuD/methylene tetrahydromethanopterin reductase-like flavin-dependent oxidoreductase (luciferase family)